MIHAVGLLKLPTTSRRVDVAISGIKQ